MKNIIYAYKRKIDNKIVYVGQTVNLKNRHYRHIKIDPWDDTLREYNYPLSRGIRKNGEDSYELVILEEVKDRSKLNDREIYYIKYYDTYYNGYNQSTGGSNPVMPLYDEEEIDIVIKMLYDYSIPYEKIKEKTGLSLTHIYNINSGERRRRDEITYPIRPSNAKGTKGIKFSPETVKEIHRLILETDLTYTKIAEMFNCNYLTIRYINKGERKAYRLEGYSYPLRKLIK